MRGLNQICVAAPLNPATILIVENEATVRMELAAQLTELGLKVLVAGDADEAIDLLDAGTSLGDLPSGSAFFPKPYAPETLRNALKPLFNGNGPRLAA